LLASEIERRLPLLDASSATPNELSALLHGLKGSAGMAGEHDLALVIGQLNARLKEDRGLALAEAKRILTQVLARLSQGLPALSSSWPEPPLGLVPSQPDERYRAEYDAAMHRRLGELDAVLSSTIDPEGGLERAQKAVHALKGAAAAVGDDVVAWYCHGLET